MSEWKIQKLDNMLTISKSQFKPNNHINMHYIGLEHIDAEKLRLNGIGSSLNVASSKFYFEKNDILFGKLRPYFRKVIQAKFAGVCSTDIWVIRAKKEINQSYLFYFLANWEFIDLANSGESGSRMPRADWNFLKNTEWKIPPLPEQKAIADVLSALDDKIDLLHRQNHTLEQMAETLFRQWFVEEAQEDWNTYQFGEVINIKYGKNLPTSKLINNGYPVFGGNGKIGYFNNFLYQDKQVLISCRGEKSGAVNISLPFSFVTNNSLVLEIPKNSILTFEFLKYHALSYDFTIHVSGSAQPQITIDGLYDAEITMPPDELIYSFTKIVKQFELKRDNNFKQIQTLETLRDTLLPKLMSGEVRVNVQTA